MFTIELLPAQRGDCLWLKYGDESDPHHVVVDAGPSETIDRLVPELERRISSLRGRTNRIELLTVSHIDTDPSRASFRSSPSQGACGSSATSGSTAMSTSRARSADRTASG